MADAPRIIQTGPNKDSLKTGFDKFNQAIDNANEALKTANTAKTASDGAVNTANAANEKSDFTQTQLDTVTGASTIDPAVEQMKVDLEGVVHPSPDARFRSEFEKRDELLAERETEIISLENTKMDKNTTDISVSQINKNLGKFDQTYMTDAFLQQMVGTTPINAVVADGGVTTKKIAPKAITPETTSFLSVGENLVDGSKFTNGSYIKYDTGLPVAYASYSCSDFVPLLPNKTYYTKEIVNTHFAFYDANKNYISNSVNSLANPFTTPSNAYYGRFTVYAGYESKAMISENPITEFIPYRHYMSDKVISKKLDKNIVSYETLASDVKGKIDTHDDLLNAEIYLSTIPFELGTLSSVDGSEADTNLRIRSDMFFVPKGTTIINNDTVNAKASMHVYKSDGTWVSYLPFWTYKTHLIESDSYIRLVFSYANDVAITTSNQATLISKFQVKKNNGLVDKVEVLEGKTTGVSEDYPIKSVAHRGYSSLAPENTAPAFKLAREKGFRYVETDVLWSSDGVPVMCHDATVDRTSNGTGNVKDLTLAQLKALDFGSWKGSEYTGTQILTFEEFIILCKKLNLHPYIELKTTTITTQQAETLVTTVRNLGMLRRVSWIGAFINGLDNIRLYDNKARIGGLANASEAPTSVASLDGYVQRITDPDNVNVFLDLAYNGITKEVSDMCTEAGIPLETYTVNDENVVISFAEYNVSGVTTDTLNVTEVLTKSV